MASLSLSSIMGDDRVLTLPAEAPARSTAASRKKTRRGRGLWRLIVSLLSHGHPQR